ncbi:DUF3883 domain-containing protein [Crocinitomix algicola]|uniref:DUF3883 domain-containing protein n=1 Tax=Crocinitomix algicola TaxID=1740263 RepID=UPI0008727A60|nr:DUF3883 domain-containing protein [Crocinitomix algicola]
MDREKINRINEVVTVYFNLNPEIKETKAKDLMPEFIAAGIFNSDQKDGLEIRQVLRELSEKNELNLIPSAYGEKKKMNTNWFFKNRSSVIEETISPLRFETVFENFKEYIKELSNKPFVNFSAGYMHYREAYKMEIRSAALLLMDTKNWHESDVGSGKILKKLISAIEIKGNNLVQIHHKWGPYTAEHSALIKLHEEKTNLDKVEEILFRFYTSSVNNEDYFEKLKQLFGARFSLIAYLFFLKDGRKFLPISTSNFEYAFNQVGLGLKLKSRANWPTYLSFLNRVREVQKLIEVQMDEEITLIDAHSFLWLIGYKNKFKDWLTNQSQKALPQIIESDISPKNTRQATTRETSSSILPVSSVDFATIEEARRQSGRKAEEVVIEYEKDKLHSAGREDLAAKVLDCSSRLGMGYDVLSFTLAGKEKHIEVKNCNSNSFYITANELAVSQQDPLYYIYLVKREETRTEIRVISTPELNNSDSFLLEPQTFKVSFD